MIRFFPLLTVLAVFLCSCSKCEPEPEPESECPVVILDTDLGNSTDDVLALHAMFRARSLGQCRIAGVMSSRKVRKAKDLLDRFLHYYGGDDIPLGLVEGEAQFFEIIPYYRLVDSLKADGSPLFEPTGIPLESRLPAWKLYRRLLSEAEDESITIVCVGMFTNLGLLLDSASDEYSPLSGMELVRTKVKQLILMGGCFAKIPMRFSSGFLTAEYNISGDVPLAKKVIEGWPTRTGMLPLEVGMVFPSDHQEVLSDYSKYPSSPMYQIYSHYDEWAKGDVGQYWWDVLTLMYAVDEDNLFSCSRDGIIDIDDQGRTTFTAQEGGSAFLISVRPENAANVSRRLMQFSEFDR